MTRANSKFETTNNHSRPTTMLVAAIAALAIGAGCSSSGSKPQAHASQPSGVTFRPAVYQPSTLSVQPTQAAETVKASSPVQASHPKLIAYKSRDYGVSFSYPWQYSVLNAKNLANADESLLPKSDGSDDQFTLARIDVPKGFYPGTDFDSGYFILSLNQNIDEQQCESAFNIGKNAKTDDINGVDFRWIETEDGGKGSSSRVRNYAAFANGTCYEMELGVKAQNDHGRSREVDPDQVFTRLKAILKTVKIQSEMKGVLQSETADVVPPTIQK